MYITDILKRVQWRKCCYVNGSLYLLRLCDAWFYREYQDRI